LTGLSAVASQQQLSAHEMLQLNELIRMESMDVQKVQAMLPMIADPELRQQLNTCVQTGRAHVKALVDFCHAHGLR